MGAVLAVPHTIVPTAGQRADARSTVHLTAAMAAEGDNFSTLHNQAVATAMFAFTQQLAASFYGFLHRGRCTDGKFGGPTGQGDVDLVYVGLTLPRRCSSGTGWRIYGKLKRTRGALYRGSRALRRLLTNRRRRNQPTMPLTGIRIRPGGCRSALGSKVRRHDSQSWPGLLTVAPIPGGIDPLTKRQQYVYSLHPLMPEGAVLYGPLPRSGRQPPRSPMQPPWWWLIACCCDALLASAQREVHVAQVGERTGLACGVPGLAIQLQRLSRWPVACW